MIGATAIVAINNPTTTDGVVVLVVAAVVIVVMLTVNVISRIYKWNKSKDDQS